MSDSERLTYWDVCLSVFGIKEGDTQMSEYLHVEKHFSNSTQLWAGDLFRMNQETGNDY